MSYLQTFKMCSLALLLLVLMQLGSESQSYGDGIGCHPPTPCPCAADGKCRPKRDSWGHYKTSWRAWPGEPVSQQPTLPDGADEQQEQGLQPFEAPLPEQEDLRGPAKDKKELEAEESSEGALSPEADALPAFAPQGSQLELPTLDDAPPALPASLRQSAKLLNTQQQVAAEPLSIATVQPVSWEQPAIALVNPASGTVMQSDGAAFQQAIYYEASDQDDTTLE